MDPQEYRKVFKDFIFKYRILTILKKIQENKKYDNLIKALEDSTFFNKCTTKELYAIRALIMELKNDCATIVKQIEGKNIK